MAKQGLNLIEVVNDFHSEEKCREYLQELRWPDGVHCPRCQSRSICQIKTRFQYGCNSCRYQFSVTAGTMFHDSHLPLWKWFAAMYLMISSKQGITAGQMRQTLGVTHKTAWFLCHRIRKAMSDLVPGTFKNIVEVNDADPHVQMNRGDDAFSFFKRSIIGAYHKVSTKHFDSYLDELEWRFTNKKNPYLFRDTLKKLIESENLEYRTLTKGPRQAAVPVKDRPFPARALSL